MIKLGNTTFEPDCFKEMSFEDFENTYKGILDGYDLNEAYKILTGRNPSKAKAHGKAGKPAKNA